MSLFPKKIFGLDDETPTYSLRKITAILAVAGYLMGCEVTTMSPFLTSQVFREYFGCSNSIHEGILVSSNALGAIASCIVCISASKYLSRIYFIQMGAILWLLGCIISSCISSFLFVLMSRLLKGMTMGIYSIVLAVYIGEIYPPHKKGPAIAIIQLSCCIGMLSMYYLCIGTLYFKANIAIRLVWAIETLPAIFLYVFSIWLPESPVWLIDTGSYVTAQFIQNEIAINYNQSHISCKPIPLMSKIDLINKFEKDDKKSASQIGINPRNRQMLMGIVIQLVVNYSGIRIFLYYISHLCELIGLTEKSQYVAASIPYFILVVLSILPIIFIDRINKKMCSLIGSYLISIIMIILSILLRIYRKQVETSDDGDLAVWMMNKTTGTVVITLFFSAVAIYAVTLTSVPWVYTFEILNSSNKVNSMAFCMFAGWSLEYIQVLIQPCLFTSHEWQIFLFFGITTFLFSTICLIAIPDTTGLSSTEVDNLLREHKVHLFKNTRDVCTNVEEQKNEGCVKTEMNFNSSTLSGTFSNITEPIQLYDEEDKGTISIKFDD